MTMPIPKGTEVRVQTHNGGDAIVILHENYRPTFDVVVSLNEGQWFIIQAARLKSIEVVQS